MRPSQLLRCRSDTGQPTPPGKLLETRHCLPGQIGLFFLSSNFVLVAKKKSLSGHGEEMSQNITSAKEEA